MKVEAGKRKDSLQLSLTNFHLHPGNPRTLQSMKIVAANVLQNAQLEKWSLHVKFRQLRAHRTASKQCFWPMICFFPPRKIELQHVCQGLRTQYFDFRFIYVWKVVRSQKTKLFLRSGTGERCFPGFGSLTFYSSCFLLFLLSFLTVKLHYTATLSCTCLWILF